MSAQIQVDLGSPVPPYEQIRAQVSTLVSAGALAPGDRLPTIRTLASDLGVAPGTVARAYKELEAEGTVTALRRRGTVIAQRAAPPAAEPGTVPAEVGAAVGLLTAAAGRHGLSDAVVLSLLRDALAHRQPATTLEQ
ncbi:MULTISPECIES: GntR family transcriptional regulator [Arthrobacter]|uniref:GntR family transcriptional regulator n=1 Tax=Arthrobacter caoxuetaonis TaxID=2886935 RepID=A0A9X1MAK0_9MICC|nr:MULTISPECIES: GntR family transcriptional regulator [Arthrobacter]MCC3281241.1 GntR family transcriptional regulator [Arthrobacter caoxuetaonis]MCC3296508.1 GntR family transcriptional regulator [Arthrobacter caoxuetaonis]MCC9192584.1 GntR family transcriptional regulator [Arthrobacter sp. zg-Y916]USQ56659.1 GntR family transcriptional regulator [Arthrobacter caoxuetaonis]